MISGVRTARVSGVRVGGFNLFWEISNKSPAPPCGMIPYLVFCVNS